ncbi:hypothetical protein [Methanoculleus chikugoensis]|nr:hypothetical protein [Methanoculleus chikugoensis]MDD4568074.1 hypothetical protein [Methanoculleus chikugoensis]NMA11457.1 hypothetical protein [Methanomicrobiales archaeon]
MIVPKSPGGGSSAPNHPHDHRHHPADDPARPGALVEGLLAMNKALAGDLPPEERSRLEAACEEADREIDRIVYALYGLTEEKTVVMEGAG